VWKIEIFFCGLNELGADEKQTILDEVVFILFLCYITVTCRHTIVFYGKYCFSNIKTSSKRNKLDILFDVIVTS
jgi:hypothetical protein